MAYSYMTDTYVLGVKVTTTTTQLVYANTMLRGLPGCPPKNGFNNL